MLDCKTRTYTFRDRQGLLRLARKRIANVGYSQIWLACATHIRNIEEIASLPKIPKPLAERIVEILGLP